MIHRHLSLLQLAAGLSVQQRGREEGRVTVTVQYIPAPAHGQDATAERHQLHSKVQYSTVYDLTRSLVDSDKSSRCLGQTQYTTVWLRLSGLGTDFSKQIKPSIEHYDIQDRKIQYSI